MTELAKGVSKLICVIKVKAGEDGKMFGSVTAGMIADELKHQFDITLDKRKIHLEHPIKTLGEHEIELHLHAEVKGTLKVRVESLTPATAPRRKPPRPPRRSRTTPGSPGPKSAATANAPKPKPHRKKRNRTPPKSRNRQKPTRLKRRKKPNKSGQRFTLTGPWRQFSTAFFIFTSKRLFLPWPGLFPFKLE